MLRSIATSLTLALLAGHISAAPVTSDTVVAKRQDHPIQNCYVAFHMQIDNSGSTGGYLGQAGFTQVTKYMGIYRGDTRLAEDDQHAAQTAPPYDRTWQPEEWLGDQYEGYGDPIQIKMSKSSGGAGYDSCSVLDTNSGQYYEGYTDNSDEINYVPRQTGNCRVDFLC